MEINFKTNNPSGNNTGYTKKQPISFNATISGSIAGESARIAERVLATVPLLESSTKIACEIKRMLAKSRIPIPQDPLEIILTQGYPDEIARTAMHYMNVRLKIDTMRDAFEKYYSKKPWGSYEYNIYPFLKVEENLCKLFGVANCGEYASMVMRRLLDMNIPDFLRINIENKGFVPFLKDHVFVCINPGKKFNLRDIYNHPNAVVIDAWDNTAATAREQINKTMDLLGLNSLRDMECEIEKFGAYRSPVKKLVCRVLKMIQHREQPR